MTPRYFSYEEPQATIAEYGQRSLSALDRQFGEGAVPVFADIEGETAGGWLAKPGHYWWAQLFIKVFLGSPWARWTGKTFATPYDEARTGTGANLFANHHRPTRYPLKTYIQKAEVDENPCLTLEYPFPSLMYGLIDDVRQIESGILLGQMHYKFPWSRSRIFIGYFLLCCLERT